MAGLSKSLDLSLLPVEVFLKIAACLSNVDLVNLEESDAFELDNYGHAFYITLAFEAIKEYQIRLKEDQIDTTMMYLKRVTNLRSLEIYEPGASKKTLIKTAEQLSKWCKSLEQIKLMDCQNPKKYQVFMSTYVSNLKRKPRLTSFSVDMPSGLIDSLLTTRSLPHLTTLTVTVSHHIDETMGLIDKRTFKQIKHLRLELQTTNCYSKIPMVLNRFASSGTILEFLTLFDKIANADKDDVIRWMLSEQETEEQRIESRSMAFAAIRGLSVRTFFKNNDITAPDLHQLNLLKIMKLTVNLKNSIEELDDYLVCANLEQLDIEGHPEGDRGRVSDLMNLLKKFKSLRLIKITYRSKRCHLLTAEDIVTQLDFLKECNSRKLVLSGLLRMRSLLDTIDLMSVSKRLELAQPMVKVDIKPNEFEGYKQAIIKLIMLPNIRKSLCFCRYSNATQSKLRKVVNDDIIADYKRISGKQLEFRHSKPEPIDLSLLAPYF